MINLLTVALIVCKLIGAVDLSWFLIFMPLLIGMIIRITLFVVKNKDYLEAELQIKRLLRKSPKDRTDEKKLE